MSYWNIDADNHFNEADDAFTRFIEPEFSSHTVRVVRDGHGRGTCYIGNRVFEFVPHSALGSTGAPSAPGIKRGMRNGTLDPDKNTEAAQIEAKERYGARYGSKVPGVDRTVHLAALDDRRTQAAIVFASHGLAVEYQLSRQAPAPAVYGVLRAFNRWIDTEWGFDFEHRIFAVPLISLLDPELAVAELERVKAAGARAVALMTGRRLDGTSPAVSALDPFWARIEEAGVLACFHAGDNGVQDEFQFDPTASRSKVFEFDALQSYARLGQPISDTIAMLILHNLFGRFPKLKVASIENGSNWVPLLLDRMDVAARIARKRRWPGGPLDDIPSEIFRHHVLVNPFCEEELVALLELIGPQSVVYGSDFPHPEGSAAPEEYVAALPGVTEAQVRAIMRENTMSALGLSC
jgi:predicted TIM-barrel fold metal-dependent hydrolase